MQKRRIDVNRLVQQTVDSFAPVAEEQEIVLASEVQDNLPAVHADPDRVAQVLRNLLANALRHTPSEGTVTVTTALKRETVEISVMDTGEGISPQDLPHLFERFWQADRARTRIRDHHGMPEEASQAQGTSGTGLGLSVAQSLVEAHGGRIWAESIVGVGSTFRFTLPLEQHANL